MRAMPLYFLPMKRSKILLLNPTGWVKDNVNLGLCHLAASLKGAGFTCEILDANMHHYPDEKLIAEVRKYSPTVIGISVKTATSKEGGRLATILAP